LQRIFLKKLRTASVILCSFISLVVMAGPSIAAAKDQSRISPADEKSQKPKKPGFLLPDDLLNSTPETPPLQNNEVPPPDEYKNPVAPYDINDIPALIKLDLTVDIAKRAIDAFVDVGTRYDDQGLYDYSTLEEYVKKTKPGKQLEADVKKYGFQDIVEWNTAIMNVSFAYGALIQDQEQDITIQIESVKQDKSLSREKKRRIIASLLALIPTRKNVEIIRKLNAIPTYQKKLLMLEAFE